MATSLFDRQRHRISTWLEELTEEIAVNDTLIHQLKNHAEHIVQCLNKISSVELFPNVFSFVNSSLLKYNQTLIEINCKLEALLTKEIKQWDNSFKSDHSINLKSYQLGIGRKELVKNKAQCKSSVTPKPVGENLHQAIDQVQKTTNLPMSNVDSQNCKVGEAREIQEEKTVQALLPNTIKNCDNSGKTGTKSSSNTVNTMENSKTVQLPQDKQIVNVNPQKAKSVINATSQAVSESTKIQAQPPLKVPKTSCPNTNNLRTTVKKGSNQAVQSNGKNITKGDNTTKQGIVKIEASSNTVKKKKKSKTVQPPQNKQTVNANPQKAKSVINATSPAVGKSTKLEAQPPLKLKTTETNKKAISQVSDEQNKKPSTDKIVELPQNTHKNVVIKSVNLTFNKPCNGSIIVAPSPLEVYIYFDSEELLGLSQLEKELELYRKTNKIPTSRPKGKTIELRKIAARTELGDYALLHSQPKSILYRVEIKDWKLRSTNDLVTVQLLDLGDTIDVTVYNLQPMPKELMKYPAFATRCHLVGLPREAGRNTRAIEIIRKFKMETVVVVPTYEGPSNSVPKSLPVVIYDKTESNCLNKLIMNEIQAESIENWDPMSEAYDSYKNLYDFDADDPAAAIYGYVGKDYERVCKMYGNTGNCFKKWCRKEHSLLNPNGFTTDKEEVYIRAFSQFKLPRTDLVNVLVTHIESPVSFYCVMDVPEDKDETLASLQLYMNKNVSEMKKLSIPPGVGQVVIGKFKDSWYRARVTSVLPEKEECTLFQLDFGSKVTVHFSKIRSIEPRYLHLPFQAIHCQLYGIEEDAEVSEMAIAYLKSLLTEKQTIRIVSVLPGEQAHFIVHLYTSKGEDVAEKLIAQCFVSLRKRIHLDDTKMYLPG